MERPRSIHPEGTVRFGPFCYHAHQRLVADGNKPLRLGSKALEILHLLIENAGAVVSKETIIAHVWPSTVVEDINLRVQIAALRRVLRDGQGGQRYIVNVPQRGYSFVAEVQAGIAQSAGPAWRAESSGANLPVRLSAVEGRDAVVERLIKLLPVRRFITLVAAGGMGKTTVAVRAAELLQQHYGDGVVFVDLAALTDSARVPAKVLSTLGLGTQGIEPGACLADHLRNRHLLLLLDNCEHLIDACANLAEHLLKEAPRLSILATSREPLLAVGESVQRLIPLSIPEATAHLSANEALKYSALQLFVSRVAAHQERFTLQEQDVATVADICRRLDGSPLAIELAAARVEAFGLEGLRVHLDGDFLLSMRGQRTALSRQQSLRDSLSWSYALLSTAERTVLQRLAVLKAPVTLDQAITVVSCELLGEACIFEAIIQLAAKSLLFVEMSAEGARYGLLNCTRAYALEKLRESQGYLVAQNAVPAIGIRVIEPA
nr:winged helix-turn-helix domain-containing protein [uncultured Pseudomonas sp.]